MAGENFRFWHELTYNELFELQSLADKEGDVRNTAPETPGFNERCVKLFDAARAKVEKRYGARAAGTPKQTHERLTLIEVKVGARGDIAQAKREMAVLAKRMGVTVHAEINDELCLATPDDETARVYMKTDKATFPSFRDVAPRDAVTEPEKDPEWEVVHSTQSSCLDRIEVPGGWIYRSTQWYDLDNDDDVTDSERTESSVFVAKP